MHDSANRAIFGKKEEACLVSTMSMSFGHAFFVFITDMPRAGRASAILKNTYLMKPTNMRFEEQPQLNLTRP